MKWTCEGILDHAEELADRFEAFDPAKAQEPVPLSGFAHAAPPPDGSVQLRT